MRRTSLEARCSSDRVRLERSETQFSSLSSSAAVRIFVMMMIISITHMILYLSTNLQITGDTPHYTTITGRRVKMSVNSYINSILNGLIPYMPLCRYLPTDYLPIHASVNFLCQSGFSRFLGFQTEDIFTTITTAFIVIDLDPGESLSVPIR